MARRLAALAALAAMTLVVLIPGCTSSETTAEDLPDEDGESPGPADPAQEVVDLTVYLRAGDGSGAHLVPVTREVRMQQSLPRRALELLIAGPEPDEDGLKPPLPTTTRVLDLVVDDHTAHVDLSSEVIADASEVGANAANEALALVALADTLTEFPEIDKVRLTVEGQASGAVAGGDVDDFWGDWGLPEVLVRDETVVDGEGDGEALPELDAFTADMQTVGSKDGGPVDVRGVRTRDRTTYLRVVLELADAHDDGETPTVPTARAWASDAGVVLDLHAVAGVDDDNVRVEPPESGFAEVDVDHDGERLRVTVTPDGERDFALSTLTSPVRVVLDVRK